MRGKAHVLTVLIVALSMIGATAFNAHAASFTFSVEGTVNAIDAPLAGAGVNIGDIINIDFNLIDTVPDSNASAGLYAGTNAVTGGTINIATFKASGIGSISSEMALQDDNFTNPDGFGVLANGATTSNQINGLSFSEIEVTFLDFSQLAFSGNHPTKFEEIQNFVLSDFSIRRIRVKFGAHIINGVVTDTSLAPTTPATVPEPSTMLLFGSGLAAMIGYRWKKKHIG